MEPWVADEGVPTVRAVRPLKSRQTRAGETYLVPLANMVPFRAMRYL